MKTIPKIRKGQGDVSLGEEAFKARARELFSADCFEDEKVESVVDSQWMLYEEGLKFPHYKKAGRGFAKPEVEVGIPWLNARHEIARARIFHDSPRLQPHVLVINGASRSDNTCPGEMSKTHRLARHALDYFKRQEISTEYLDLSRLASEYGRHIHPCKACVSTAMPLCHWPCSCYPNHALGQVQDWMNEIYPMWTRAHGVMILTPVYWYGPPSGLKLMMDRMVCADGGNPDYTTTEGKNPKLAKKLELEGWSYPRHLEGRLFSVITHGDAEGALQVKQGISGWLRDMGLTSAGNQAEIDRYIDYYGPYAKSHDALDREKALFREVSLAAQLLAESSREILQYPANLAPAEESRAVRQK